MSQGIAGLSVAGLMWTTGYTVHSDVLDSTISPIFTMYKKLPVMNVSTFRIASCATLQKLRCTVADVHTYTAFNYIHKLSTL